MPQVTDQSWQAVLAGVKEYQEEFPNNLAFIGGIAVYCHAMANAEAKSFVEQTHDADFMIATAQFYELRGGEDHVMKNARLGKYQTERRNIEFDIYEQQISNLIVPVSEVLAASEIQNGIRVASLEHLFALKMAAFLDRQASPRGVKDASDVARILYLSADRPLKPMRLAHVTPDMLEAAGRIAKSDAAIRLARGNAHMAHKLKSKILAGFDKIEKSVHLAAKTRQGSSHDKPNNKDGYGR